ncbi:MAG: class I SAM-dependent methyltransferase [Anaerolineae bacterium]|jgi:SAM-dependent methyltransferase
MRDFYERFYAVVPASPAHALFCQRAFGLDLGQHGFADVAQLDALIAAVRLGPEQRGLDLGCGDGRVTEYLSDRTGAHLTGLDYIPEAVRLARTRTRDKADRLAFVHGDLNALALPAGHFDAILSIDTIYFSQDYARTIGQLAAALRPGGRLVFLHSYGWQPGADPEAFDATSLAPERTPLGEALRANGLSFHACDWTAADCRLARSRRRILEALEPQFRAEGLDFVYENRMAEARGIARGCDLGLHRRYLVCSQL